MSESSHLPAGFHVEYSPVHKAWLVMLDNEVMRLLLEKHYTRAQAEEEARRMARPMVGCETAPWKGAPREGKRVREVARGSREEISDEEYALRKRMARLLG